MTFKPFASTLSVAVLMVSGLGPVQAQGLLGLTQSVDYEANIPFSVTASARAGYDSIKYSSLGQQDVETYFLQSGVGLRYGKNDRVTPWNVGVDLGVTHYLDSAERGKDTFYNTRASFNISHQFSRRLTVGNNFYATYEIEPDYGAGVTSGRRSGQYIYGYNNTSLAYAWTRRISTTTGYTIDGIKYIDDKDLAGLEDRLSHTFSQQVSYALSRRTSLTAEYRFRMVDYDSSPRGIAGENFVNPDSTSHFVLIGVDQAWSDRLTASVRAGVELYQSDRASETAPYVEGALNYAISRKTNLRWFVQAGYDGSELGMFSSRYSYRSGLTVSHQFTRRLNGYGGLHYIHSEFDGGDEAGSSSENELNASIGLTYNFWQNLSLDANYSFTTLAADQEFRDYDRHRLSVGLNATF
jgi:opacity protein-like surface antigen